MFGIGSFEIIFALWLAVIVVRVVLFIGLYYLFRLILSNLHPVKIGFLKMLFVAFGMHAVADIFRVIFIPSHYGNTIVGYFFFLLLAFGVSLVWARKYKGDRKKYVFTFLAPVWFALFLTMVIVLQTSYGGVLHVLDVGSVFDLFIGRTILDRIGLLFY